MENKYYIYQNITEKPLKETTPDRFKVIDFDDRKGIIGIDILTLIRHDDKISFISFSVDSDFLILGLLGFNIIEFRF